VPTVSLGVWDASSTLFDGDVLAGLVPTLFGTDPEAINSALKDDPARLQWDILKLNKLLFTHEHISLKDAVGLMKKPR